jgi:signal peptidase II
MRKLRFLLIGAAVLVADQVTKALVMRAIPLGGEVVVTRWFTITHWRNPGGLFGLMNQLPRPLALGVFIAVPLVGIAFLALLFARSRRGLELCLLSAILGGALGNLADRLRFGAVVDFLYVHIPNGPGWPAFNVADACLSTGILALLALTLFTPHAEDGRAPDPVHHR